MIRVKVCDLRPMHSPKVSGERPALKKLTDKQLLAACEKPTRGDPLRINTATGLLMDGNGRAYELIRRATLATSMITPDTEILVEPYVSDNSMFID